MLAIAMIYLWNVEKCWGNSENDDFLKTSDEHIVSFRNYFLWLILARIQSIIYEIVNAVERTQEKGKDK